MPNRYPCFSGSALRISLKSEIFSVAIAARLSNPQGPRTRTVK